jgi:hypothetical protein
MEKGQGAGVQGDQSAEGVDRSVLGIAENGVATMG